MPGFTMSLRSSATMSSCDHAPSAGSSMLGEKRRSSLLAKLCGSVVLMLGQDKGSSGSSAVALGATGSGGEGRALFLEAQESTPRALAKSRKGINIPSSYPAERMV